MIKLPNRKVERIWMALGLGVTVIVFFAAIFLQRQASVGMAYTIGEQPGFLEKYDLVKEEAVEFVVLPEGEVSLAISTPLTPFGTPKNYWFKILRFKDNVTYQFQLTEGKTLPPFATDVLNTRIQDKSYVYLSAEDTTPDLEIAHANGIIKLTNLHFVKPGTAVIEFYNQSLPINQAKYPSIIKLERGKMLNGTIMASSSRGVPTLVVKVGGELKGELRNLRSNQTLNSTSAEYNFTAPQESQALILDVIARVGSGETHRYYTLAIGNVAYALKGEPKNPDMELRIKSDGTGLLNVTFKNTRELQPVAFPCRITEGAHQVFRNSIIERVYAYDNSRQRALTWISGALANDLTALEPFQGYFVKLEEIPEGGRTEFTLNCNLQSLQSYNTVTPTMESTALVKEFRPGWHLISLPGTVPRTLREFSSGGAIERAFVYECRQKEICSLIDVDTPLGPGKSYWLYTEEGFTIRYLLE